jgi:DDE superfamily endonuclease
MLSYAELCRHSSAFPALTGLTRREFDALLPRFTRAEADLRGTSDRTRRGSPRARAAGAGRPYAHQACDRLLMALLWLRVYPTYEVLGFFFALHERNAQLNVRTALEVLDALDDFPFDRPGRDRKKLRSAAEVMAAFPQVRYVIDAKEQRINKPRGEEKQKPYYSGKKKAHTIKTQVVVNPRGQIAAVSASVPGSTHDLTLLVGSGVLEGLSEGEGGMLDKGVRRGGEIPPGGAAGTAVQEAEGRGVDRRAAGAQPGGGAAPDRGRAHDGAAESVHGAAAGVSRQAAGVA